MSEMGILRQLTLEGFTDDVALALRVHVSELVRIDNPLALLSGKGVQVTNPRDDHATTLWRKLFHLPDQFPSLLDLGGSRCRNIANRSQNSLPLLRGQAIEAV